MICLRQVNRSFGEKTILNNGELVIKQGELTSIIGKSGAGKSSLLHIIGLIGKNSDCEYLFNDLKIDMTNEKQKAKVRRLKIGYVFQDYNLLPQLNIQENFEFMASLTHQQCSKEKMLLMLESVHLNKPLHQKINTLSGGERQRLAIALALSKNPDLIVLDEPTSSLDQKNTEDIVNTLKKIAVDQNKMVVIATHNKAVWEASDTVYEIVNQKIQCIKETCQLKETMTTLFHDAPIRMKFYMRYAYQFIRKSIRSYLLLFTMSMIVIAIASISFSFIGGFNQSMYESYNNSVDKTLFIINDHAEAYSSFIPAIEDRVISLIKKNESVEAIYPYVEYKVDGFDHLYMTAYKNENRLKQYQLTNKESNGFYIPSNLVDQISLSTPLEIDYEGKKLTGPISGVYPTSMMNDKTFTNATFIYFPMSWIEEEVKSSAYYVEVKDIQSMNSIKALIQNIDSDITIKSDFSKIMMIEESLKSISQVGMIFSTVLFTITICIMTMIYFRWMLNRKIEISLLKANGLMNKQIVRLMMTEIIMHISIVAIGSYGMGYIFLKGIDYLYHYGLVFEPLQIMAMTLGLCLILFLLPTFIVLKYTLYFEPAELLKKE